MKLALAQDMRRIDELAATKCGLTIDSLMESAGKASVRAAERIWGPLSAKKVLVLCGPGNNGGDGLAAARLLRSQGVRARAVLALGGKEGGKGTREQLAKAKKAKVPVLSLEGLPALEDARSLVEGCDLVLDALFGTGLSRPLEGVFAGLVSMVEAAGKPVLALDVPSGLDADRGLPLGPVLRAQATVTFGLPKAGLYTPQGSALAGQVLVDDIGFPSELLASPSLRLELSDEEMVRASLPRYDENIHKGTRGRLLVVAASTGLTGAASLCAYGAQRIGAGRVTVACPASLNQILEVKLTEPMTAPMPEVQGGFLSLEALGQILERSAHADAVVLGPGIGLHPETGRLLEGLFSRLTVPMVVDADALNLLGGDPKLFRERKAPAVLTPHPGEAARLLKSTVNEVEGDRVKVAKQLAQDYNAVVVLKGRFTVIADPQGLVRINPTGNRGLATAGTGDVLSGILGGLLAQRLSVMQAATLGVFLHGLAGEEASRGLGPDGLLAGDLLPVLPGLLRRLRENGEPLWPSRTNSKPNGKRTSRSSK